MAKKRRKVKRDNTWTFSSSGLLDCVIQKTVRMRTDGLRFSWKWKANLGGYWLEWEATLRSMSGAMRSGNAWARRMGLTPKWEE